MAQTQSCGHILIIEDNESLCDTFKQVLDMEGYHVVTAKNGQEAFAALNVMERPCLIFLDMFMPIMNSWQFLEQLKMRDGEPITSIPIIICSAAGEKTVSWAAK